MKKIIVHVLAAVVSAGWADAGAWKVSSWSPVLSAPDAVKKVIDGTCPGHSQGMCVTSNAFYLSFHNQIVKTDWKGRFLKRVEAVPHGGDICYWKGRVYVGAWEPPAKKGAKGCTAIRVYDAETLEPVKERRMPEWQNAADGITCLDGVIILAMGMEDWNSPVGSRNYYGKFDAETLEPIGKPFVVDHGEQASCGAQNITTDGMYIYSCYYTSDEAARTPNFIVYDRDFKVVGKHLFGWTHGVHPDCFKAYVERFGRGKVRERDGKTEVRLATYSELKQMFEVPGKFLMLPGVEITTDTKATGVTYAMHMNVIGIDDIIERAKKAPLIEKLPKHTVASAIRETREMSEALARKRGNPPFFCMVNHPNWLYYDVFAQDIIDNPEIRYFEVCNNGSEWPVPEELDGEWYHDNLWDAVLAYRLTHGQQMLYGLGTDDTHFYPDTGLAYSAFGDAYIMVLAEDLTQKSLLEAIHRGDFYAASQQDLEDVSFDRVSGTLKVSVPATPGVAFKIRFISTKKGAPLDPVRYVEIPPTKEHFNRARKVPVYDARIGATVKLVEGKKGDRLEASYTLASDDLYVRARVESDAPTKFKRKRCLHPAHHTAWTQPYAKAN